MGKKILVIDDDELMLRALDCLLMHEEFQTKTLAKAELIENVVSDFRPDLIVMDIRLDTADGRTVCDRLKADESTSHIPIILLTGLTFNEIAHMDCHADAIIGKPFKNSSLLHTIKQFLRTGH